MGPGPSNTGRHRVLSSRRSSSAGPRKYMGTVRSHSRYLNQICTAPPLPTKSAVAVGTVPSGRGRDIHSTDGTFDLLAFLASWIECGMYRRCSSILLLEMRCFGMRRMAYYVAYASSSCSTDTSDRGSEIVTPHTACRSLMLGDQ